MNLGHRRRDTARLIAVGALLVVLVLPAAAGADVGIGASNSASGLRAVTFPLTVAAGADRLVAIGISTYTEAGAVSVTYGGVQAVRRVGLVSPLTESEIWTVTGPNAGTANVTVTLGGDAPVIAGATAFTGVDPVNPLTDAIWAPASTTGTAASLVLTNTAPGDAMFGTITAGHVLSVNPPTTRASTDGVTATQTWGGSAGVLRGAGAARKGTAQASAGIGWGWTTPTPGGMTHNTQALIGLRATGSTTAPTVITRDVFTVTARSARLRGDLWNTGGAEITDRGFVVCTCPIPVIGGAGVSRVSAGAVTFAAPFEQTALGLEPATTYTYRAYSSNAKGAGYGDMLSFTTAANSAPAASAGGPYTAAEGSGVTLDARGSSDPDGDVLTYAWDLDGDGSFTDATGATPALTWAQLTALGLGDGPASTGVRVRVSDGSAPDISQQAALAVTNTAPSGAFGNDGPVQEGARGRVSFTGVTDPSAADLAAGVRYAFDFNNDGTYDVGAATYAAASPSATVELPAALTADGPATRVIAGAVLDRDGGLRAYTTTVTVANVAPIAALTGKTVDEGDVATIGLTGATDTAFDRASLRYAYDFDDNGTWDVGSTSYASASDATTASLPAALTADGPATRAVRVAVVDKDGASTVYRATIVVRNVAPQATLADVVIGEGASASVEFTAPADVSAADATAGLHYEWDADGDGTFTAGASRIDVAAGNGPATRMIRGAILDRDGGRREYAASLTVHNVAPTVSIAGPDVVPASGETSLTVRIADAGQDALTAKLDWGDGTIATLDGSGEKTATHTYAAAGAKAVTLVATDADGASSEIARHTLTVESATRGGGAANDPPPAGSGTITPGGSGTITPQQITRVAAGCIRATARTGSVRFSLRVDGSVEFALKRLRGKAPKTCPSERGKPIAAGRRVPGVQSAHKRVAVRAGANTIKLTVGRKPLRPGTYQLTLKSGGATASVKLRVLTKR